MNYWIIDVRFFVIILLVMLVGIALGPISTYPAFSQADSGLQAIDPSQAEDAITNNQMPQVAPDRHKPLAPTSAPPNNFPPESMIPEFSQPLPAVPASPESHTPAEHSTWLTDGAPATATNPSTVSRRLAVLEQTTFGATYYEHDADARLEHLEREVLGGVGSGNEEARLAQLENTIMGKSDFGALDKLVGGEQVNGAQPALPQSIVSTAQNQHANFNRLPGSPSLNPVVEALPFDASAGDYAGAIQAVVAGQFAYWTRFPIHIHLPPESPEEWQKILLKAIEKWKQYIPLVTSSQAESADIEIVWVNHLVPKLLGITRLVIISGRMHVQVFMLRPSFYPPQVPEKTLELAVLHELGHAIGLFGHSDISTDIMYPVETTNDGKVRSRHWAISPRDLNSLKKVYQLPGFLPGYTMPHPMEWGVANE